MLSILLLVGFVLIFWLLLIRPQSRRQKELQQMQSSLSVGDEVMLTSGVYATVEEIEDDHLLVEIADGVVIKVVRAAVGNKVQQPDEPTDEDADEPIDEDADEDADDQAQDEADQRPDDEEPGTTANRPEES